jgi:magnesium-transporting ATPase (P-type)
MANEEPKKLAPLPLSIPFYIWYVIVLAFCIYITRFAAMEIYEQYWDNVYGDRKIVPIQIISISITFIFFFISTLSLLYRLLIPISKQIYVGKLVGRFITMACVIGLPLMIYIFEPNSYRPHARNADAKHNLHLIYTACKQHWASKGPDKTCDLYAIRLNGYVQSKNVLVELGKGKEFSAIAWHARQKNKFIVNAQGDIKKLN